MNLESVLPVKDQLSEEWFAALGQNKLLIQRDPVTSRPQFYPRAHVIEHPDRLPEWFEASGRACLYSYTIVQRTVHPQFVRLVPLVLAIVELEEGPRLTAWLVDTPEDKIVCDMHLQLSVRPIHEGLKMPCFTGVEPW